MADKVSMALAELVRKAEADGDVDVLKERRAGTQPGADGDRGRPTHRG
jgi:hypothetical protein